MNFSVNNQAPAFKGIYVVEGTGKEIKNFEKMIDEHCEFSQQIPENIAIEDKIYDFKSYYISEFYGDKQQGAKILIATNEDCLAYNSYYSKYREPKIRAAIARIENDTMNEEIIECFDEKIEPLEAKMAEFEYSHKVGGNALLDFIEKTNKTAETILGQIKEFTTKEIKTFKFKDIVEAMGEDRFNIATGKMKAKIKL